MEVNAARFPKWFMSLHRMGEEWVLASSGDASTLKALGLNQGTSTSMNWILIASHRHYLHLCLSSQPLSISQFQLNFNHGTMGDTQTTALQSRAVTCQSLFAAVTLTRLKATRHQDFWGGCRDGSVVKSTDCSSRGPGFNSQQPHGSLQPSVTPVPSNPTSSPSLCGYASGAHTYMQAKTHTHKIRK